MAQVGTVVQVWRYPAAATDDPDVHRALSDWLGFEVRLGPHRCPAQ